MLYSFQDFWILLWLILLTQPKKAHFSFFGYLPLAIDSTLGQLQKLSKPWIIHLLAQLIACSLSPFCTNSYADCSPSLTSGVTSAAATAAKGGPCEVKSYPDNTWKEHILGSSLISPLPSLQGPQSVSKHQNQKQKQRQKAPSFSLPNLFVEAEEKPKGKEKQRHKVLLAEQPGHGKQREVLLPISPGKAVSRASGIWAGKTFFYSWRF